MSNTPFQATHRFTPNGSLLLHVRGKFPRILDASKKLPEPILLQNVQYFSFNDRTKVIAYTTPTRSDTVIFYSVDKETIKVSTSFAIFLQSGHLHIVNDSVTVENSVMKTLSLSLLTNPSIPTFSSNLDDFIVAYHSSPPGSLIIHLAKQTKSETIPLRLDTGPILHVQVSSSGKYICACTEDSVLILQREFSHADFHPTASIQFQKSTAVSFSESENNIAICSCDGLIKLFSITSPPNLLKQFRLPRAETQHGIKPFSNDIKLCYLSNELRISIGNTRLFVEDISKTMDSSKIHEISDPIMF
ncbi:hypothetical protein BLNAU_18693 [Blattamonas nauphoetae]|uniref:Uncharacterized protein n=1 Tax=Blattamonas nauphoetae TaxID=2049346 RepID=A0ABQ9X5Z9_9EUKA|nr:hypothetical protein BLNAU_18693 [Blattamonas nauphoetae]